MLPPITPNHGASGGHAKASAAVLPNAVPQEGDPLAGLFDNFLLGEAGASPAAHTAPRDEVNDAGKADPATKSSGATPAHGDSSDTAPANMDATVLLQLLMDHAPQHTPLPSAHGDQVEGSVLDEAGAPRLGAQSSDAPTGVAGLSSAINPTASVADALRPQTAGGGHLKHGRDELVTATAADAQQSLDTVAAPFGLKGTDALTATNLVATAPPADATPEHARPDADLARSLANAASLLQQIAGAAMAQAAHPADSSTSGGTYAPKKRLGDEAGTAISGLASTPSRTDSPQAANAAAPSDRSSITGLDAASGAGAWVDNAAQARHTTPSERPTHERTDATSAAGAFEATLSTSVTPQAVETRQVAPTEGAAPAQDSAFLAPIADGIFVRQGALRATPSWSSFHVVLQPQALGMVTVHVERNQSGLQVTLTPQHAATGALLDKHLPDLVATLRGHAGEAPRVSVVAPLAHSAEAATPAAPTPQAGAQGDGGLMSGHGFASEGGRQMFDGRGAAQAWYPPDEANAAPPLAGVAATTTARSAWRMAASATARIDVQA